MRDRHVTDPARRAYLRERFATLFGLDTATFKVRFKGNIVSVTDERDGSRWNGRILPDGRYELTREDATLTLAGE